MSEIVERLMTQARVGLMGLPDDFNVVSFRQAADCIAELEAENARLREAAPEARKPVSIVPPNCSGYSFVFEPGVLHVKKDGSGYIAVNEDDFVLEDDRCEGPDGPEGSVHWIARMEASEIIALRDFLNGNTTADRLADKIEDLIAEFGDDPKAALECVSEHLSLRRHAQAISSREVIDV